MKFREKTKLPKFRTKDAFIWVFLGQNFEKLLSYFKSAPSNLCNCKILLKNKNRQIWENKNPLFRYFWARFLKYYCHIWNQHPEICWIVKFHGKTRLHKFGTKNALFRYFWVYFRKPIVLFEISTLKFLCLQ